MRRQNDRCKCGLNCGTGAIVRGISFSTDMMRPKKRDRQHKEKPRHNGGHPPYCSATPLCHPCAATT